MKRYKESFKLQEEKINLQYFFDLQKQNKLEGFETLDKLDDFIGKSKKLLSSKDFDKFRDEVKACQDDEEANNITSDWLKKLKK